MRVRMYGELWVECQVRARARKRRVVQSYPDEGEGSKKRERHVQQIPQINMPQRNCHADEQDPQRNRHLPAEGVVRRLLCGPDEDLGPGGDGVVDSDG